MAGQPQENSWTQQGQQQGHGYSQGTPGYGPAYGDQQGTPPPYPQGQAYEQPGGYEQQPPAYPQGQVYEQGAYEQQSYQQPAGYEQSTVMDQPAYNQSAQQAQGRYDLPGQPGQGQPGQGQPGAGQQGYGQPQAYPGQQQSLPPGQAQGQPRNWEQWQLPRQQVQQPGKPAKSSSTERGFVGSLFDFGFTSFVTPKIIKVLYVLVTIWTILWALVFLRIGFHYGGMSGGLATLIIVDPILVLVSLGVFRVVLEFFMVTFRIQEDLKSLREHAEDAAAKAGQGESGGDGSPSPGNA